MSAGAIDTAFDGGEKVLLCEKYVRFDDVRVDDDLMQH
jgi:hypothetical protein